MGKISLLSIVFSLFLAGNAASQHAHSPDAKAAAITELSVDVEGGRSLRLKTDDLAKLPKKELKAKGHDGVESVYSGFDLRDILIPAGAKFGKDLKGPTIAQFLIVEAADGYRAVFSLTELEPEFTDKIVLLADQRDGKTLAAGNGPWQIIASNEKKHGRWVRQVTALKVRLAK